MDIWVFLRFVLAFGLLKCQEVYKLLNSNFDCFIQLLSLLISIKGRNQKHGTRGKQHFKCTLLFFFVTVCSELCPSAPDSKPTMRQGGEFHTSLIHL